MGDHHLLILTQKKELQCYGDNTFNQLAIPKLTNCKKIDSGAEHCGALTDLKSLHLWGLDI